MLIREAQVLYLETWVSVLTALRCLQLPFLIQSASFHFLVFSLFLTFFPAANVAYS